MKWFIGLALYLAIVVLGLLFNYGAHLNDPED